MKCVGFFKQKTRPGWVQPRRAQLVMGDVPDGLDDIDPAQASTLLGTTVRSLQQLATSAVRW